MAPTIDELKRNRLSAMTADERAVFDETYEATRLALDVGERSAQSDEVSTADLTSFTAIFTDLEDPEVMRGAW
jgi:hypothetical protein